MSGAGRNYFSWNMLMAAKSQDERRDQSQYRAGMRTLVGNPLEHTSETKFLKLYRINKEAFEDLCQFLSSHCDLKGTQRVSLQTKVSEASSLYLICSLSLRN